MLSKVRADEVGRLLSHALLIGDGGMGTRLHDEGVPPDHSLELLNVERPDQVRAAHRAFLLAGSDVVQTNTFQGNPLSLAKRNLAHRCAELNRAGAAIAREVAGGQAYVAGSIGPTGELLDPYGTLSTAEASAAFREQARALAEGGVDLLILETFFALEEISIALDAALETALPVVAGMAFDPNGHTSFGVSPEQAAARLESGGATAVGANCGTVSPSEMVRIIARFRQATGLPLFAQPNAGRPHQTPSGITYPQSPQSLADAAECFRDLGATLIGGCDGTTPDHIGAVVARLRSA